MTDFALPLTPELAVLLTGAVLGGVVQGVSGFAFGMVAMSVWAWSIDPVEATVMAVFGGLCGQVFSALSAPRPKTTVELLPFLVGGLIGVPIGTQILPYIDAIQFKFLLGTVLAVGCPVMLAAPRVQIAGALGRAGDGAAGIAGGIIGGISGLTGISPAIWGAIRGFDKSRRRELLQTFNMAILTATLVALTLGGAVTTEMAPRLGIVSVALLAPSIIGRKIHQHLPGAATRVIVLTLLTASGIGLVISGVNSTADA
jgi:uncharacterized membrane protein YfcA